MVSRSLMASSTLVWRLEARLTRTVCTGPRSCTTLLCGGTWPAAGSRSASSRARFWWVWSWSRLWILVSSSVMVSRLTAPSTSAPAADILMGADNVDTEPSRNRFSLWKQQ